MKLRRPLTPRATHENTLVMRSSAAPLPVPGPGGWVKAEVSRPVTRQPLRCGPARGPAGWIIPGPREPSERRGVLSVQRARLPHGSVLMVRRGSGWLWTAEHARYVPRPIHQCWFGLLRERMIGRLLVNRSPPFALALALTNFLYGLFQGHALRARRAVPAPAGSVQDRDALREFVRRPRLPPGAGQDGGATSRLWGGRPARDLRAVALRSRAYQEDAPK
jgi:hypothetical protein